MRFEPRAGASWVDIGSGAGLPGIVIACLVDGPVTLVEPRRLRAEFLHRRSTALGFDRDGRSRAKAERVEGQFDVITARAVAPLGRFARTIRTICPQEKPSGCFPRGETRNRNWPKRSEAWQGEFHVERACTDADR